MRILYIYIYIYSVSMCEHVYCTLSQPPSLLLTLETRVWSVNMFDTHNMMDTLESCWCECNAETTEVCVYVCVCMCLCVLNLSLAPPVPLFPHFLVGLCLFASQHG